MIVNPKANNIDLLFESKFLKLKSKQKHHEQVTEDE